MRSRVSNPNTRYGPVRNRRQPDRLLWWIALVVIIIGAVYVALAPNGWALVLSSLLAAVALLLNHKRLLDVESPSSLRTTLVLAVLLALSLTVAHFGLTQ